MGWIYYLALPCPLLLKAMSHRLTRKFVNSSIAKNRTRDSWVSKLELCYATSLTKYIGLPGLQDTEPCLTTIKPWNLR